MEHKAKNHNAESEESFAMALLKGYKRCFYITTSILTAIIFALIGYIVACSFLA